MDIETGAHTTNTFDLKKRLARLGQRPAVCLVEKVQAGVGGVVDRICHAFRAAGFVRVDAADSRKVDLLRLVKVKGARGVGDDGEAGP